MAGPAVAAASATAEGWFVPKLLARVLAIPWIADPRREGLRKLLAHPAGPFTSASPPTRRAAGGASPGRWRTPANATGAAHAARLAPPFTALPPLPASRAVHFWAPTTKWLISLANLSDLYRPVESISLPQQAAISTTGIIWSYYATQVIPFNTNLLTVNVFMAGTGLWHISRIVKHSMAGGADAAIIAPTAAAPAPAAAAPAQHR